MGPKNKVQCLLFFTGTNKLKCGHISSQPWQFALCGKRDEIGTTCIRRKNKIEVRTKG